MSDNFSQFISEITHHSDDLKNLFKIDNILQGKQKKVILYFFYRFLFKSTL